MKNADIRKNLNFAFIVTRQIIKISNIKKSKWNRKKALLRWVFEWMLYLQILTRWPIICPDQVTSIIFKTHLRLTWSNESPRGHNTTGAGAALISIWLIRIIGKTEVLTIIVVGFNVELEFSCWDRVPKLVHKIDQFRIL